MEELEKRIVEGALHQFLVMGIRAVTMDDVARELGISKKTLYRFFSNKADLVHRSVQFTFWRIKSSLEDISSKSTNAIDELFEFDVQMTEVVKSQKPIIINQLRRYYPETHNWLHNQRKELMLALTERNLEKGVLQGMYREDLNIRYIALMYYAQTLLYAQEDTVPDEACMHPDFVRENLIYHLRGIVSEQGLDYVKTKLKQQ